MFPDKYHIMWREHGILRSTDPDAGRDPSFLQGALFMHNLTTGQEGDIYVEVAYRFYGSDHEIDADQAAPTCRCETLDRVDAPKARRRRFQSCPGRIGR